MLYDREVIPAGAMWQLSFRVDRSHTLNDAEFTEAEVDTLNLVPDDLRGLDRFEARTKVVEQITAVNTRLTPYRRQITFHPGRKQDSPAEHDRIAEALGLPVWLENNATAGAIGFCRQPVFASFRRWRCVHTNPTTAANRANSTTR